MMEKQEALEVIKKQRGCIDTWDGVECLLREDCGDCQYYYDNSEYEEAMKVVLEALEKQIPKRAILQKRHSFVNAPYCPNCGYSVISPECDKYCGKCGQAIDWSDNE